MKISLNRRRLQGNVVGDKLPLGTALWISNPSNESSDMSSGKGRRNCSDWGR